MLVLKLLIQLGSPIHSLATTLGKEEAQAHGKDYILYTRNLHAHG